jgi:hypothetical protein
MKNGLVVNSIGTQAWYQNNKLHRLDGPAIIYANETQEWYKDDQRHRTDGPACVYPDGSQEWWVSGSVHRWDGPAVIGPGGIQHWFIKYRDITEKLSRYFNKDLSRESLTRSELVIFKLKWS